MIKLLIIFLFLLYPTPEPEIVIVEGPKLIREIDIPEYTITEEEARVLAVLTIREAGGESILGQRLVIDTVLNRIDRDFYPNDILSVIYQPNQYTGVSEAGLSEERIQEAIDLVYQEVQHRTNWNVLYFCNSGYNGPVPLFVEGNHWFSGQGKQIYIHKAHKFNFWR